jgi:dTMP kinase
MTRPPFISLDGIDGTGKSTQMRLLAGWLEARGWRVTNCADPGSTPLGDLIRDILLHRRHEMSPMAEALLFMASRAELLAHIIRPALDASALVLCDRFLLATVVYQGHGGGLDVDSLWNMGRIAAGRLEPDLTIVLDLPIEQARQRRGRAADRLESREIDFHERVRQGFLIEARKQPDTIRVIDASPVVSEVHARICEEVEHVLATHPRP